MNRYANVASRIARASALVFLVVIPRLHAQTPVAPPSAGPPRVMLVPFDSLQWTPRESAPGRSQISIVHVDPVTKATQLYFKLPPRMHAPRHWHSANETNVVVRGTFVIQHDGGEKQAMKVGDFNWMPKRMIHQAWSGDEETIVFVSLDGAWDVTFVPDSVRTLPPPRRR